MVKHVILWKLREDLSAAEKQEVKKNAKQALEGLTGKILGLLAVSVEIEGLAFSNADMMLNTSFTDEAALQGYQKHPEHVAVADTFVRPFTQTRLCLDFEAE